MTNEEQSNLDRVHAFFAAMQEGDASGTLADFYAEDVVQDEYPNRFLPEGATRSLEELHQAAERGRSVMASQTFEILSAMAQGATVAVEAAWTGTLAIPIGPETPAGTVMRARFAQFFEFREGRIVKQRNYDCFYPW